MPPTTGCSYGGKESQHRITIKVIWEFEGRIGQKIEELDVSHLVGRRIKDKGKNSFTVRRFQVPEETNFYLSPGA